MFFEYRFYDCTPGRLDEETARMEEVSIADWQDEQRSLFSKYGITPPIAAWSAIAGRRQPVFGYLLKWDSFEQRDTTFPPFWASPEWAEVRDRSNAAFPMVDSIENWIIRASTVWDRSGGVDGEPVGGIHEMRVYQVRAGYGPEVNAYLAEFELPQCEHLGGEVLGVFDVAVGPDLPAIVSFVAWPDFETQQRAANRLHIDPRLRDRQNRWKTELGVNPVRHVEQTILRPLPYGKPKPNFGMAA